MLSFKCLLKASNFGLGAYRLFARASARWPYSSDVDFLLPWP